MRLSLKIVIERASRAARNFNPTCHATRLNNLLESMLCVYVVGYCVSKVLFTLSILYIYVLRRHVVHRFNSRQALNTSTHARTTKRILEPGAFERACVSRTQENRYSSDESAMYGSGRCRRGACAAADVVGSKC